MATSHALEDLQDLNTCEICMDPFEQRDPRGLVCFHVFCFECIQQVYLKEKLKDSANTGKVKCPVCREDTSLKSDSTDELPKYFQAQRLQDVIDKYKTQMSHMTCNTCGQNDITTYCFSCPQTLCDSCQIKHDSQRRYQNHLTITVDKTAMASLICTSHDQTIEAFCTDCLVPVCRCCQGTDHRSHNIEEFCIRSGEVVQQTDECKARIVNSLDTVLALRQQFNDDVQSIHDDIHHQKEKLIQQIEEQAKELHSNLRKHETNTNKNLDDLITNIQDSNNSYDVTTSRNDKLTKPLPSSPSVTLQDLHRHLSIPQEATEHDKWVLEKPKRYTFLKETDSITVGSLSISGNYEMDIQLQPKTSTAPTNALTVVTETKQPLSVISKATEQTHYVTQRWEMKGCDDGRIINLTYLQNGDLLAVTQHTSILKGILKLVVGISLRELQLYDLHGQLNTIPFSMVGIHNPGSSAYHGSTSTVAIGHGGPASVTLTLFSLVSGTWNSMECQLNRHPWALSFTTTGDIMIVTAGSDNVLMKYSCGLKKLWEKEITHISYYMAIDKQDRVILPHHREGFVSVYDAEGTKLFTFPKQSEKQKLITPRGVCTDTLGNIFVADSSQKAVFMFNSDGGLVTKIVEIHEEPLGLALYQDKYLAVGTSYGKVITMNYVPK